MSCKICQSFEESSDIETQKVKQLFEKGDYANAFGVALPLAVNGNVRAQCLVGSFLMVGVGIEVNELDAEKWLLNAGEKGCPLEWHNLSTLYLTGGKTLQSDKNKASEYQNKAIENGFVLSESKL